MNLISGGGLRCGVAWNTLFLALITAAGTTLMGTLIALLAVRGNARWARPLNILALLPIVTPPFVVGLGLILLFGRAGLVNQALEAGFGITPSRWFYGLLGLWLAQLFSFTPIAFMIVRSMTTVSAVVFLVTAENELATPYIIGRVGNGDYGVALAYCTVLILLMSAATALIQALVGTRKPNRRAP